MMIHLKLIKKIAVAAILCFIAGASYAGYNHKHNHKPKAPTPKGFDKYLVYMAAGTFNPNIPHPDIPGCANFFCDGAYFQEKIMQRSPAEIEQESNNAKAFFLERFGVDIDSPDSGMIMNAFMVDPRKEYRLYTMSGRHVPSRGYTVRDGGFMAVVVNPEGITLGGEFEGLWVPPGTALVYGNYNILVKKHGKKYKRPSKTKEIIIRYKATGPIYISPEGFFEIACELEHDKWGHGLAQGSWKPQPLPDGRVKSFVRNILTFPGLGEIPPM